VVGKDGNFVVIYPFAGDWKKKILQKFYFFIHGGTAKNEENGKPQQSPKETSHGNPHQKNPIIPINPESFDRKGFDRFSNHI